ncbi:MAG TPA: dethiobiotin synthase [Candidatus Binataceae bacterium]|nr:dethiobiotin synthase [Candidatus Binataceae bacterium]
MRRRFLISGTDTDVGKTTLGSGLAFAMQNRGLRVGVMKPVETGCAERGGELIAADAEALNAGSFANWPMELVCPYRYRAPLAPPAAAEADGAPPPDLERIADAYRRIEPNADVMIIEGAGGLMVPITWEENYADLALRLDLELVLVIANRLGALNVALLTLDYAARRAMRIAGYVFSDVEPGSSPAMATNPHSLARLTTIACLGHTRHKAPLDPAIVQHLL